ncbi:MAG: hypothetical protein ACI9N9_000130 [Enterobacterales bacterium]|jgi:hypothetical protein
MKSLLVSLVLSTLLLTSCLFSAEIQSRATNYDQINKLLVHIKTKTSSPFVDVDQNVVINTDKESNAREIAFSDIRIWLSHNGEVINEVPIDAEGKIDLPIIDEKIVSDVKFNVNQESSVVAINLSIGVKVPTTKEISYKDLFILLEDTNVFINEMAGSLSWFTPSMDELLFKFSEPATITIKSKKKSYLYKTNDELEISISIKSKLMKEDPLVIFSHLPLTMSPED